MIKEDILYRIADSFDVYEAFNAFCIEGTYYSFKDFGNRIAAIQLQIEEFRCVLYIRDQLS